ncbi:MAG: fibronectin type III domain-containing protein [Paludibacteraceae bacterium]|nr:fibronectin type III domain-containing protein [Paludibacteraceae bacterium]
MYATKASGTYDASNAYDIATTRVSYVPVITFTFAAASVPDTPSDLHVASTVWNAAELEWSDVAGATSYDLQQSTDGSSWTTLASGEEGPDYTWSGLAEASTQYVRIRANNANGSSDWSDAVTVTTDAKHIHDGITFNKWNNSSSIPLSGDYYLNVDVTISGLGLKSLSNNLNLCLNGHTATFTVASGGINIPSGYTLTVFDNAGGGLITSPNGTATIQVASGGTLDVHAGNVTNTGDGKALVKYGDASFDLSDNVSNTSMIVLASVVTDITVNMTRSLTSSQYNTFCLPFALTDAQLQEYFGAGYDLEEFVSSSLEDDVLNLSFERKYALEAGKPYLLQPSVNVANPSFEGVTIAATSPDDQTSDSYISFHGTFAPTELAGGNKNLLFLGAGNELFWPASTGNIKAFRAYFEVKGAAQKAAKRARIVQKENTTTGVDQVSAKFGESDKLLRNGQLLIIRDNKTYNVLGQPVQL